MNAQAGPQATWLDKWRSAEPEMAFAEPFVPAWLRPRVQAWGSWLAELEYSLLTPSEAHVAVRRLGWWLQELAGEQPQHPLAQALRATGSAGAPAGRVVAAALQLAQREDSPGNLPAALDALAPFARAVASAEAMLFSDQGDAAGEDAWRAVARGLLARRLPLAGNLPLLRERLPLDLLARHGGTVSPALLAELAALLSEDPPRADGLPLYRALRWELDLARLRRFARGHWPVAGAVSPPPLQSTWRAWRAARAAAAPPPR